MSDIFTYCVTLLITPQQTNTDNKHTIFDDLSKNLENIMKRQLFFTLSLLRLITGGYLDPNTGGMIFQMLAAGFAAISGFILVFSRRIKLWFVMKRRERREKNSKQSAVNSKQSAVSSER